MRTLTKNLRIYLLLLLMTGMGSACSENMFLVEQSHPNNQVSSGQTNSRQKSHTSESGIISIKADKVLPEGMLAFEGSVFVASTEPLLGRWHMAGWQIASQSLAVVDDQVPMDCTLYPHQGVEDQWIGSCSGDILIPKDGANHLVVMHTPPGGNTTLVQVAPTPDTNGP